MKFKARELASISIQFWRDRSKGLNMLVTTNKDNFDGESQNANYFGKALEAYDKFE